MKTLALTHGSRRRGAWRAAICVAAIACGLVGGIASGGAWAQRPDERPVLEPPKRLEAPPPRDVVPAFATLYANAGSPRIAMLWNRTLSDRTALISEERQVLRDTRTSSNSSTEKSTSGVAGDVRLKEADGRSDRTRVQTRVTAPIAEPGRRIGLEERHALMVERAFMAEMNRAGVRFVDRSLAMRSTAAAQHRSGGDAQLIEMDALLKFADLLLEVVWIEDREAPSGYAFDVRTKDLQSGQELTSVYTRGIPVRRAQPAGAWVAGKAGYEFALPPPPPEPTPADVGTAASHDVMRSLGAVLAGRAPARGRGHGR